MSTAELVKTALISSSKNAPIIRLEIKKPVPAEGLCMNKQQEAKIQAVIAALNVDSTKPTNADLVNGLDAILNQAYENNKKMYQNQVKLAATNHPSQLPSNVLAQLSKALNQTLATANPAKAAEQTQNHTSGPRRTR